MHKRRASSLLNAIGASYLAAAMCFAASAFRDYVVVTRTDSGKQFFELFYIASLAGAVGVNAITFARKLPSARHIVFLALVGIAVLLTTTSYYKLPKVDVISSILVYLLWLAGGIGVRGLLDSGWLFVARVRDGITSLAMTVLVLIGFGMVYSFVFAVAVGAVYALLLYVGFASKFRKRKIKPDTPKFFSDFLLVNTSTVLALVWALHANQGTHDVFGLSQSVAVRVSLYAYQALFIASYVVIAGHLRGAAGPSLRTATCAALTCAMVVFLIPIHAAVFVAPLAFVGLHYSLILYVHQGAADPV